MTGFVGALLSTVGVVLPSFFIIAAISFILKEFQEIAAVKYAFWGIRAGVLALIIKALWTMYKQSEKGLMGYIIMALAFIAVAIFDINVLWVIVGCAVLGLVSSLLAGRERK